MKQSGEICSIFLLPLMTSAMKTVGWTHVHTVEIAIMKEPISLVPSVNPAIIPSSASQTALLNKKAGCLLADTELVSVLTLADIFIMRIFPPMRKILLPVIECRPEKFLVSWEIPIWTGGHFRKVSGAPSPWHLYHHPRRTGYQRKSIPCFTMSPKKNQKVYILLTKIVQIVLYCMGSFVFSYFRS